MNHLIHIKEWRIMVGMRINSVVPYDENGALLEKYYKQCALPIDVFIKKGADHHPHGLENPCIVADIIEKF